LPGSCDDRAGCMLVCDIGDATTDTTLPPARKRRSNDIDDTADDLHTFGDLAYPASAHIVWIETGSYSVSSCGGPDNESPKSSPMRRAASRSASSMKCA